MRSYSSGFIAVAVGLATGAMMTSWAQELLPLPTHEGPSPLPLPLPGRSMPDAGVTRYMTPNVVATPPPLTGDALRQVELRQADFRPWRVLDKQTAAGRSRPAAAVVPPLAVPILRGIMLLPGIPEIPGRASEGMEAYAASVPIPPNLRGVRDYGAEIPKETLQALEVLVGAELNDTLVPRIREAVILGFAGGHRKLDSILIPEMGGAEGILKVVVIEALPPDPEGKREEGKVVVRNTPQQ